MRKLLTISLLLISYLVEAQVVTSSWADPCTGEVNIISVPTNGQTVVTIYNQSRVVTAQDVLSGSLTSWIASAFQSYSALSPCSQGEAQTQATNQAVQQTAQQAATAATAAATAAPPPVPAAPTPPPPTQTTAPTTSTPNTTTNGNNQNTSSGSTAQGSNQGSTDSGNTSGGGTDNSSSSTGTDGGSGNTSQDSQGSTESQGSEDQNSQSSESNNQEGSSSSEGGEDQSGTEGGDESSESENTETEGGDSEESSESEQESEEVEEKEDSSEKEESEEESTEEESEEESTDEEEESEEESTEEEEEEEEEKKNTNPPIVIANISTMQGLDGSYSAAMTFGVSRSSMRGDKNYGVTSMVWSNLKQYMLMGSFSKTFFIKGKPKLVYSAGLMGGKMFTTLMGGVNNSLVYLSSKGSVYGLSLGATTIHLNYQIKKANILVDQSLLSGTATGFWTKSYNFDRYSLSPMLAVSSPFVTMDIYDRTTTYNKDLTFITGVSGNYKLTQRFVLNLGVNATHNTNKEIRSLLNFTIGSRFSF